MVLYTHKVYLLIGGVVRTRAVQDSFSVEGRTQDRDGVSVSVARFTGSVHLQPPGMGGEAARQRGRQSIASRLDELPRVRRGDGW